MGRPAAWPPSPECVHVVLKVRVSNIDEHERKEAEHE